jgi:hypothetical protein
MSLEKHRGKHHERCWAGLAVGKILLPMSIVSQANE